MAEIFHFSLDVIRAAAQRWEKHRQDREKAAAAAATRKYDEIDTRERIAKHANRLRKQVLRQVQRNRHEFETLPRPVKALVEHEPIEPKDIEPAFVERVLGPTRDFLSVEFFELATQAVKPVARIVTELDGQRSYGTGFMVSEHLLITNHHVLEEESWAAGSVAQFDYQRDRFGAQKAYCAFRLDPARFFLADPELDYALVAVTPQSEVGAAALSDFGFCPLVGVEGKILVTHPVNIIQHPQGRPKEVVIRENKLSALPAAPDDAFAHYLADTEPGSSGSPVFNDRWEVIALHHASVPARDSKKRILTVDGKPWEPGMSPDEIQWVGNEGIRISRIIARFRRELERLTGEKRQLLSGLLMYADTEEMGPVRPIEAEAGIEAKGRPSQPRTETIAVGGVAGGAGGSVTVPLTLTITLGAGAVAVAQADVLEKVIPDRDYARRPGFDTAFLEVEVPMPRLVDERHGALARLDDGTAELKYHHFSVMMNADRRLAYVSAVNYDSEAPFNHERGSDDWFFDPRLPEAQQADNRHYKGKHNPLDRGHLARRADAAWGASEREAKLANDDTFHWTNCSPQHQVFNQSKLSQPKDLRLWGELENHIAEQAQNGLKRLSIFNGPVFDDDDRDLFGLRVPTAFWKVVAYRSRSDGLRALGFVLHQTDLIANLEAVRFDPGKFDVRQVRISAIEELTGLDFGGLRNVDPMASAALTEIFEGTVRTERKLEAPGDILF